MTLAGGAPFNGGIFLAAAAVDRALKGSCNTHFLQESKFWANRSAYKNAYQIIVLVKNFPKINLA
jgi:hypothetical protein